MTNSVNSQSDTHNASGKNEAMMLPEARAVRGFIDRRGPLLALERQLIETVSKVYETFGFSPLMTPAFEYADALGKFLPDQDRPNEGVFSLKDDDEQWMALRYDHTAPLARFVAQGGDSLGKPYRRYTYGPVWRNEKPGPGRLREFLQCDADTVGSSLPEADGEIIALGVEGFRAMGISCQMRINNRRILEGVLKSASVTDSAQRLIVLRALDKLDRLGLEGVKALLGAGRLDDSGDFTKGAGLEPHSIEAVLSYLSLAGGAGRGAFLTQLDNLNLVDGLVLEEMGRIDAALTALGITSDEAVFDGTVVRGLEYYTGPVFEAELLMDIKDEKGRKLSFGSVGGGGRYDDLVARFTGQVMPATGFSFGVSRLAQALTAQKSQEASLANSPIIILSFGPQDMGAYLELARDLRQAGLMAEVYLGSAGLKAQMKYADRRGSPAAIMMGSDEIALGTLTIKDLDLGRALSAQTSDNKQWRESRPGQVVLPRLEAIDHLKSIIAARAKGN
jgi:histidyl-tRNA synthetase